VKHSGGTGYVLFNLALNLRRLQRTSTLCGIENLRDQLGVTKDFTTLHETHDSSLRLEVSVGGNTLVRRLILLFCFLELDLVDLDAGLLVGEVGVEPEFVGWVYVLAFGALD
jgi:hypothetical protein